MVHQGTRDGILAQGAPRADESVREIHPMGFAGLGAEPLGVWGLCDTLQVQLSVKGRGEWCADGMQAILGGQHDE